MTGSSRPFSTASIKLVADELTSSSSPTVETVLQKLLRIDSQIDADFNTLKSDLSQAHVQIARARSELQNETSHRAELQARADEQQVTIARLREQLKAQTQHQKSTPKPLTPRKKDAVSNRTRPGKSSFGLCRCAGKENVQNAANSTEHEPTCELKKAVLAEMDSRSLCDILTAREEAYRAQTALVDRLKTDNRELKGTYEKLWSRYQDVYNDRAGGDKPERLSVDERIQHLSFRVQQAGQAACIVASQVEQRLQLTAQDVRSFHSSLGQVPDTRFDFSPEDVREDASRHPTTPEPALTSATIAPSEGGTSRTTHTSAVTIADEYENDTLTMELESIRKENKRFNVAGKELMRTLMLQQEAHDRLRSTVVELTKELERIEPEKMETAKKCREDLEEAQDTLMSAERELLKAKSELKEKSKEISNLKKQLKKVLAEYEAVSIAHSYSNAELSKIRAKTRQDRQTHDRPPLRGNAVNHGVENLLHHRRNHFR